MEDIDIVIKWYEEKRPLYGSLALKTEGIIKKNLEQRQIQYHSVTSRGKSLESFTNKAKNEKYSDRKNEIKDMAGVRVITYLESEVGKIADIIEKLFVIDRSNSLDQGQLLGSDRLGYRSVHYVVKFDRARCKLPEYSHYKDLFFEIQIRSLLQHTWAEIEHDRNYKFTGKLPIELERRFYLVSGMLECADREFVSIAEEIDKYKNIVTEEIGRGDLDIAINTTSLREYLTSRFSKMVDEDWFTPKFAKDDYLAKEIVEDVQLFGITKLRELDAIIPNNFEDNVLKFGGMTNFAGLVRNILIVNDVKAYFEKSWRQRWGGLRKSEMQILEQYNVDLTHVKKHVSIDKE